MVALRYITISLIALMGTIGLILSLCLALGGWLIVGINHSQSDVMEGWTLINIGVPASIICSLCAFKFVKLIKGSKS